MFGKEKEIVIISQESVSESVVDTLVKLQRLDTGMLVAIRRFETKLLHPVRSAFFIRSNTFLLNYLA